MGFTYNKGSKKNRTPSGVGPRDHQLRRVQEVDHDLVNELRAQVKVLQDQLKGRPASEGGWTHDQVNSEIEKAIKAEIKVVRKDYEKQISDLTESVDMLEKERDKLASDNKKLKKENSAQKEKLDKNKLEAESLRDKLKNKEELIQQLKESKSSEAVLTEEHIRSILEKATADLKLSASELPASSDRPQMEEVFIDPLENNADSKVDVSNLKVETDSDKSKEEMQAKVNKLKGMLGKKFPAPRPK